MQKKTPTPHVPEVQPIYAQRAHKAIDTIAAWHVTLTRYINRIPRSVWIFPLILCTIVVTLTVLRISGTSVGVYSQINGEVDKNALVGNPRGVRSDEWLVTTQMTVAQAKTDYKKINQNIGESQNMALLDVPYKDWSIIFKPQNLSFFILPLEFAFAFKWWVLLLVLIVACYFFILELFPRKFLQATLTATFVGLSPMVFWWWTSGTLLTIGYGFLMALFAIRLMKTTSTRAKILYTSLLCYILICFALLLYPPFQIPCFIAVATFVIGWAIARYRTKTELKTLLSLWPYALLIILVPLLAGFAFYQTNKDVISSTTHTVYPGSRVVTSGGTMPLLASSSFLSPNLAYDEKAAEGYMANQSEASTFIFITPYLFLPSLYVIARARRKNSREVWGLLLINILIAVFLVRMYIPIPWLEPFYKPLLLDKVPNVRLLIGLGMAGVLQLLLLIKVLGKADLRKAELWGLALFGGITSLVAMLYIGNYTIDHYPVFIASFGKVLIFSLWIACAIFLLLRKQFILGVGLLVAFSLLSVYRIHPLYRGLAPVTASTTIKAIQSTPDKGSWVVLDDRLLINAPLLAGRESLTGIQFAPQLELWRQLDPQKEHEFVYNRYAHVLFVNDEKMTAPLTLKYADLFVVKFDACSAFAQKNITYVLSPKALGSPCVKLNQTINTPAKESYIYEITPSPTL